MRINTIPVGLPDFNSTVQNHTSVLKQTPFGKRIFPPDLIPGRKLKALFLLVFAFMIPGMCLENSVPFQSPSGYAAYPQNPAENQDYTRQSIWREKTQLIPSSHAEITLNTIGWKSEDVHAEFLRERHPYHINPIGSQLFRIFVEYDLVSRLRYKRGVGRLFEHKTVHELSDYLQQSRWYREALKRYTTYEQYGFSENRMVRTLLAMHTSAHFFDVPYPTLFCLFFQESKLDFKAVSRTGARGIGQLTSIALREMIRQRKRKSNEQLLQSAYRHLNSIYHDPLIHEWMGEMGLHPRFPQLEELPKSLLPVPSTRMIVPKVIRSLKSRGAAFAKNTGLVRLLIRKAQWGETLPIRYAQTQQVFVNVLEKTQARNPASIHHIETNVLLSSMLFSRYYRYRWSHPKGAFSLNPGSRALLAVAAYNHGPSGARRLLIHLQNEFPKLDFADISAVELARLFTPIRLAKALRRPYRKVREAGRHVRQVLRCSNSGFT